MMAAEAENRESASSSSPLTPQSQSGRGGGPSTSCRTPAEDRLLKRMEKKNDKGETQLHRAAIKGNRRMAEILLVSGVIDSNAKDYAGETIRAPIRLKHS